jgi:long-chain acyl-CoA synthetase
MSSSAATTSAQLPPNTDAIWYASYPPGVPHEIDVTQYASLVQFFDECTTRFADRVAYVSAGASMTYRTLAQKVDAFAS